MADAYAQIGIDKNIDLKILFNISFTFEKFVQICNM
jgi:hypothetical protein